MQWLTIAVQGKHIDKGMHYLILDIGVASCQVAVECGPEDANGKWIHKVLMAKTVL
jgi:hypothetical protein